MRPRNITAWIVGWPILAPVAALGIQLDFSTFALESGSDLQVGAVYRYTGVATGVEALLSIDALNNGATISRIDDAAAPPPTSGSFQALQPVVNVTASLASNAVFTVTFVDTGTSNPTSISDFILAAVDIDGGNASGTELEYVRLADYNTYTLESTTQVTASDVLWSPAASAKFIAAIPVDFPGVDITNTDHIAEVDYTNITSFTYTVGVEGTRTTERARLYSLNPYDTVVFTDPVTVPEPGACILAAVAGLIFQLRRRRSG